jgi:LuxR family maltose regulon positive regulatory protein
MTTRNSAGLTSRERDVLDRLVRGCSNQQIAQQLFISVYTVQNHMHNIFGKLNVSNRTMAVTVAYQCGLVGADGNS